MAVDVVFDGQDALDRVTLTRYDVIVLDRDLPGVHGDQVCRELAERRCPSRMLMLTAASTIADRVEGLSLGADDYLPKPFDFAELIARIRALARRAVIPLPPTLIHGDLVLDPARRVAVRGGRRLALTPKEFALLECLLAAKGTLVSAEELLERVWMKTPTCSPPRSEPPSGGCAPSSATRPSSRPSARPATGSAQPRDWHGFKA